MSIARQLFRDLRPLIQLLEEPFSRSSAFYGLPSRPHHDHLFWQSPALTRPAVDVKEEGNNYVLEADLPGVKKEDVEVRIGDGGRSLTIEGKLVNKRGVSSQSKSDDEPQTTASDAEGTTTVIPSNQIFAERSLGSVATFTRTVWLPRPVDSNNVVAKLTDGVLSVTVPKAEDKASVKIPVE